MNEPLVQMTARAWPVRCRELACIGLAFVLAVLAFEIGKHSVHHLNDAAMPVCVIAGTAGHVLVAGSLVVVAPLTARVPLGRLVADAPTPALSTRPPDVPRGRAPPSPLSA